jgi:zinc transport system permease protein
MPDFSLDDFMIRAVIAATGLALVSGPLGCFLVWRRMAFFGDALSHSALLGVALGILLQIDLYLGVVSVCGGLALILSQVRTHQSLSHDTWLGIVSYTALAGGMVALSLTGQRVDAESILFGDILAVGLEDLAWIWGAVLVAAIFMRYRWRLLLLSTFNEDISLVSGVRLNLLNAAFMIIMALVVAVALKTVGALLIPALLIIPAASAAQQARSPEQMVLGAILLSLLTMYGGLASAFAYNTPTGPTIILVGAGLFLVSLIAKKWQE